MNIERNPKQGKREKGAPLNRNQQVVRSIRIAGSRNDKGSEDNSGPFFVGLSIFCQSFSEKQ
jgi:hypothetical protein